MNTEVTYNQLIYINRGDTLSFPFYINIGTNLDPIYYDLQEGDALYFGVMEVNQPFECALIRKKYESTGESGEPIIISLEPKDTLCLIPGTYYFSVKLRYADGNVKTLISKRKFVIL